MTATPIDNLDDPRLEVYRHVKDRDLAGRGERFIAESELVVRRLIASPFPVESVLVVDRRAAEMAPVVAGRCPLYIVSKDLMRQVIGFNLQSGIIACGRRLPSPSLDDIMSKAVDPITLMVLPEAQSTENLGAMVRIAGAFGCTAVILGERSCDPFYRQSIRISMGTVFSMPIVRSLRLLDDLHQLRERWHVRLAATVLQEGAVRLSDYRRPSRLAVLFGNEAQGLASDEIALCDDRLVIPMSPGVDSLNVAVAAGIVMYAVGTRAPAGEDRQSESRTTS
jgi:tRNA G18 (ribose-2'-O)-methylase SpoU